MAQIKTFARLKPTKKPYGGYEINKNVLTVHLPDSKDFLIGPQQTSRSNLSYDIVFTNIFKPEATQEDVFDGVAKGIIQSFLNGYNGTIFAYGQTGTGKTYTVEGNATRYSTRGLSTRALSMIYQQLENRVDDHITVCLSYLEIYQEVAYDLLNPISRSSLPMAPFAKVTVVEGPRGSCIFRGLSLHLAANEEIAQMLLLQGQANRKVAETPVNQRSSRSHAVFTVYLQVRKHDSDVLLNSKLHLVDLAGSERVSKTGVDGQQLTEAKSINLSLHHLETVIIALQTERGTSSSSSAGGEKIKGDYQASQSRSNTSFMSGPSSDSGTKPYKYVPYRNSLLTMVLKDSLGGNCLTAMIATISMEPENLGESISTCRFAQRVARIANNARRNEEVDDKTVIKRLRHKVANLEHQLDILRSKGKSESIITDDDILSVLSEDDRSACAKIMEGFLQGAIADPVDAGIYDHSRFRECLHLLKYQYLHSVTSNSQFMVPPQLLLQPRQSAVETAAEGATQMQPNNPHRDSGDHAMSEATQADSAVFISQQRPPLCCSSVLNMQGPEEYLLVNEDQVVGSVCAATETEKKIAEKKGSELDQLLESCTGKKHCPPYDKQRVKAKKKHSLKLTSLEQEQAVKQDQLAQISQDILMQELLAAENNLRLKLQVVEEQVIQQHAYLMQLRHNQADAVQIAREQLVEQHLLKRQAKFHDKLSKLLDNKVKLQCSLSPDRGTNTLASSCSNRMPMPDRSGLLKHGKGCQTCQLFDEDDQHKLATTLDRDTFVLKGKQLDIKEQVQTSNSVDSNRSLRCNECLYGFVGSHLQTYIAVDKEPKNDHSKIYPAKVSSRTGLHSKEKPFSEIARTADQQSKQLQEYLTSSCKEKLCEESRQGKCNDPMKLGEAVKRLENDSNCILKKTIASHQLGQNNSTLIRQGNMENTPTQDFEDILIESPSLDGSRPIEAKSFHDPHHSHKFALDDMPAECSSLSSTRTGTTDSLSNKNNSYMLFVHSLKNQRLRSINYNTNAVTDTFEGFETDNENEQQNQFSSVADHSVISSCAMQSSKMWDSDKILTVQPKAGKELGIKNQEVAEQESKSRSPDVANDIAETVAEHSNEELKAFPKLCSILLSAAAQYARPDQPADDSFHVEDIKSVVDHDTFGFLSQTLISVQTLELENGRYKESMLLQVRPCEKCLSSAQHESGNHRIFSIQDLLLEINLRRSLNSLTNMYADTKPGTNFMEDWSPCLMNASLAKEQNGTLHVLADVLSFGDKIYGNSNESRRCEIFSSQIELDPVDVKLAKGHWSKEIGDEDENNDDLSEGNSFFVVQPAEVKLKALTSEVRERTYMLTVASERARVMKIRKARRAAEMIQRRWRSYRAEE